MTANPPNLRPDLAPKPVFDATARDGQPRIGMVSLGCPKALVDSEHPDAAAGRGLCDFSRL